MIPDIDIWRCAALMLKRYGDTADIEAAGSLSSRIGTKSFMRKLERR